MTFLHSDRSFSFPAANILFDWDPDSPDEIEPPPVPQSREPDAAIPRPGNPDSFLIQLIYFNLYFSGGGQSALRTRTFQPGLQKPFIPNLPPALTPTTAPQPVGVANIKSQPIPPTKPAGTRQMPDE